MTGNHNLALERDYLLSQSVDLPMQGLLSLRKRKRNRKMAAQRTRALAGRRCNSFSRRATLIIFCALSSSMSLEIFRAFVIRAAEGASLGSAITQLAVFLITGKKRYPVEKNKASRN